ncbi:hypothetical protein GGQ13_002985 [Salinibacter ruber]|uniref:Eco57I restriction-modification methylase domain-containing protein n=1 Tax=Salinibacter ruber TaxID=146919 RepID=UPI002168793C|nr:TaqI-like C-terminal specificity domain-containing protein [Salinibacter ruber]MCS4139530.1 hypothetical protein [Salinibacter ruber]
MPAPTLFETAFDNRGLFSDHYLEERFPERDDVQALQQEADAAFDQLRDLYRRVASEVETWNEDQTEDNFVRPVLKNVLGWARKVQPHVQKQGRKGRPDYALFTSDDRRTTAVERADGNETKVFNHADAVADAKYWGRPLDGPAPDPEREKRAEMRRNNPSFQIIDYVTITGVEWGILTNGARWRLYYEGAPSRLETYFEVNLSEIIRLAEGNEEDRDEARRAFRLFYALFRADAYRPTVEGEKFVDVIYAASDTYAETLEDQLKERVFDHVFLELATGLHEDHVRKHGAGDTEVIFDDVYRATLRLLYRLLFLLYAESRDLLPLDNPGYYEKSLTHIAEEARRKKAAGHPISRKHSDLWNDLQGLFETIDRGDDVLDVPAYNGGLFREGNEANAFLDSHEIGERYVVNALVNLTAVDPSTPEGPGGEYPSVDYTSLDVRQLGSIYEGLLEHRLVITEDDELDLQTDEGERKETGSYYTPHHVVEYIVEETLGPIVDERIEQFENAMDEITDIVDGHDPDDPDVQAKLDQPRRQALDAFLTMRVCDPAMGSGHFLVYAADYLAERFGQILGRYPDHNPVTQRLEEIRQSILDELERQDVDTDGLAEDNRLRDTSLLKRLVMKRSIYGVDLNPMAVELAKLSLWLHSFTVGAPLSFLDHHLKAGNSLIGTSVDTVVDEIEDDLFGNVRDEILRGTRFLQDAAFNTDATLADVEQSAEAFRTYQDTMRPYKRLIDLWTSQHFGNEMGRTLVRDYAPEVIDAYKNGAGKIVEKQGDVINESTRLNDEKNFFHWELEFPEVFYELDAPGERDEPGFDAVIGNPPYRIVYEEEDKKYLSSKFHSFKRNNNLYSVFSQRSLELLREEGRCSMIVPNTYIMGPYFNSLKEVWKDKGKVKSIDDFGNTSLFADQSVFSSIYLVEKSESKKSENVKIRECDVNNEGIVYEKKSVEDAENLPIDRWKTYHPITDKSLSVGTKLGEMSYVKDVGFNYWTEGRGKDRSSNSIGDRILYDGFKKHRKDIPYVKGSDFERFLVSNENRHWLRHDYKDKLDDEKDTFRFSPEFLRVPEKIIYRQTADEIVSAIDYEKRLVDKTVHVIIKKESYESYSHNFLVSILNSKFADFIYGDLSRERGIGFAQVKRFRVREIPIRKIEFTTKKDERERFLKELTEEYKKVCPHASPFDNGVLNSVENHLQSERSDVVHDCLANLAQEMTDLKAERATYHLDVTDYVPTPSEDSGVTLRDLGRYQPAPGVQDTLLADTTEERGKLRVGRLDAERDGEVVHVRATARFKPEGDRESWPAAVPNDAERDRWDYVETDPIPVCTLYDCMEIEAGLVVHWIGALNDADSGFSGYRDNATKTNSLLDRIYDAYFPDSSDNTVQDALRPFLQNAKEAAELDRQIVFTDGLIDQIVYRLYGLSDEEIAVVEQ